MIKLGQKVKCKVTGFTGRAIARNEYFNGCCQFLVRPKMKAPKKGEPQKYPDAVWIDVEELDVVGKGEIIKTNQRPEPSGGVRQHPE